MFWRKRKLQMDPEAGQLSSLAGRLGVERRYAVRILYPRQDCRVLPAILFDGQIMRVHDISVGGCCLLDPAELMGTGVGSEVELILQFYDGPIRVLARVVSRVEHKRHIHFLNLPKARAEELKEAIRFGGLGSSVRSSLKSVEHGPVMAAKEIWSSLSGDSVIIEDHLHRLAQINLAGQTYIFYKHAWPVKGSSTPLTQIELAYLTVFMCNIAHPSELLSALVDHVENMAPALPSGTK